MIPSRCISRLVSPNRGWPGFRGPLAGGRARLFLFFEEVDGLKRLILYPRGRIKAHKRVGKVYGDPVVVVRRLEI